MDKSQQLKIEILEEQKVKLKKKQASLTLEIGKIDSKIQRIINFGKNQKDKKLEKKESIPIDPYEDLPELSSGITSEVFGDLKG